MDWFKFRRQRIIIARISWLLVLAVLINYLHWDFSDLSVMPAPAPKAEAQAASQTTFYFKPGTSLAYWGAPSGTIAEYSTYTDGVAGSPTSKTTALAMHPIAGAVLPTTPFVTTVTGTETGTTNPTVVWYRTFLMPLANGTVFTSSTTFTVGISGSETSNSANAYVSAFAYVYDSNANASAKILTTIAEHITELPLTTAAERKITITNNVTNGAPAGSYTSDSYDYLAVELWVRFKNTSSTSYSASLLFGGNVAISAGGTSNNAAPASYITISGTTVDTFDPIYFQPTSTDHAPTPTAHQTADSFQAGTWDGRRAGTVAGAGAETNTQAVTVTGNPLYYRMNTWTSPPLAAQTIPAANWVVHMHGEEQSATDNAWPRWAIYVWKADNTGIRGTIYARANASVEFGAATTNTQIEDVVAGSSVAVTAGDRLVVDMELVSLAASTAGTIYFRFGDATTPGVNTYDSAVLPPMNYASTPTPITYQAVQYEQTHFQFDTDDDDETHTAWTDKNGATTEDDTTVLYDVSTNFRARIQIRNNGGETATLAPLLYYSTSAGGTYTQVTNTSDNIKIVTSGLVAQNEATTRQLTDLTGSYWDFSAGVIVENSGVATTPVSMTAWTFTEYEWSVYGVNAGTYYLRVRDNTTALTTYTNTAAVEIQAPQLGLTAPSAVVLNDGNRGFTSETTFAADELVTVTDAGAGWSLTVLSSILMGLPVVYMILPSAVKLRTDGIPPGGGDDTYTIWSDITTNVTEPAANTYALDTPQTVGERRSGSVGDTTSVRPTIQVVIPAAAEIENYTGTLTFTLA